MENDKEVLCDKCGTTTTGLTADLQSRYVVHKVNCPLILHSPSN